MSYIKVGDVAARLSVSEQTVRLWCRTGVLPAVRPGDTRQWLINEDRFNDWLHQPRTSDALESLHNPDRVDVSAEEILAADAEVQEGARIPT